MKEDKVSIIELSDLPDRTPAYALVSNVDLVIIKSDKEVSVLYGRCLHRGALLADGYIEGENLICGLHHWDYCLKTGVSAYNNEEKLHKFTSYVEDNRVWVDRNEIAEWEKKNPQPYIRSEYLGNYQDIHGDPAEPHNHEIQYLAKKGLSEAGHHGPVSAMGVERSQLPRWEDIQIQTAQLATKPLLDEEKVATELVIGPGAKKPMKLSIPILVSDMSFGALSEESKIALARGAQMAGTGICSGEGGMLPEEQIENSHYLYELASAQFGFSLEKMVKVQAFHFKGGQGAKTGTGGHLPGDKNRGKISQVREIPEGQPAISPARFKDMKSPRDFKYLADQVREKTGGIPIGFKLSANHIEENIDFAVAASADYIILDGRGGGTGAAPLIFRDHISISTIPALARARKHLDHLKNKKGITLIITGGLRTPADFAKAMCLGADGVAVSNSALQAIGCLGMRACHTNNCPVGIATQKIHLRERLDIEKSAERLHRFLESSAKLMCVLARACGHSRLNQFNIGDLVTLKPEMSLLTGIEFAGVQHESKNTNQQMNLSSLKQMILPLLNKMR